MFSLKKIFNSFKHASQGIIYVFKSEQNFRIQVLISCFVLFLAWYFPLKNWELILVLVLILMVLVMEIINTALEKFNDLLKPRMHHYVKQVKDIMAGAVFLTAIMAVIIGLLIFIPHLVILFR